MPSDSERIMGYARRLATADPLVADEEVRAVLNTPADPTTADGKAFLHRKALLVTAWRLVQRVRHGY